MDRSTANPGQGDDSAPLEGGIEALELAIGGAPLDAVLRALARTAPRQVDEDAFPASFCTDGDGHPGRIEPNKVESIRMLSHTAALLIERYERREEHARAMEALRCRTQQFETLFDEAPLGVYLIDADFRIVRVNSAARPVFGSISELIGRDFDEVMHILWPRDYADEVVHLFRHTLETGEPYFAPERSEQRRDRDATEYYEWQINRILLPDGRYGVVCYFRDISAQVEARQRLLDHQAELEIQHREKDEFLAMLAHELRNPLAPLRNAADVLSRGPADPGLAAEAIGIIGRQISHLARLVDDLMDVSRITRDRMELQRRTLVLADVIGQAVETVAPVIDAKQHRLSVRNRGQLRVDGDAARLVQCVTNLLTNAAKYMDPGGEIRVESMADGEEAVLRVSDDGAGIAPQLLPRIFDLFVQANRTLDRAQGGLGIGLSIVKRLIALHGGRVSVTSQGVGRGATFEIRLPLVRSQESIPVDDVRADVASLRIIVVDDNADAASALAMALRIEGHEVAALETPEETLEQIPAFRPDVVLLDIGLPRMDGYELARQIRAEPESAAVCLIALTGYGQPTDRARAAEAGFDEHLIKPVDLPQLKQALAHVSRRGARPAAPR